MKENPKLLVTSHGFQLKGNSGRVYDWYFDRGLRVLRAKPTDDKQNGRRNFTVQPTDYNMIQNACNLDVDKYHYTFVGKETDKGIDFNLNKPVKAVLDEEVAEINAYSALMMEH